MTLACGTIAPTGTGLQLLQELAVAKDISPQLIDEVWQIIDRRYVDGSFNKNDWQGIRRQYLGRNYTDKEQSYAAIREMLKKLGDPYTRFMNPQEFKAFKDATSGQLVGVGMYLSVDETTKALLVDNPIEGHAAAQAGIIAQDIILKIDGKSTQGMDTNTAAQLIRGQAGTTVSLTLQRGEKITEYRLVRQQIEIHPVEAQYRPKEGIGYIRLKQFSATAAVEMRQSIQTLESQGARGYILDLRSNPGGLFYSAIDIARMLMNNGKIVSTKLRQGADELKSANQTAIILTKPIVVLVDSGSASSSEILAGALHDNNRAQLVGTKTFGKGLVQSVHALNGGAGMTVTVAKYYTPNGTDINHKGIQPDLEVQVTKPQMQILRQDKTKIATPVDLQYVKALQLLIAKIATNNGSPFAQN
jgi:carboxyl-terminal processing protease